MNKTELDNSLQFLFNPTGELQIIMYAVVNEVGIRKLNILSTDLESFRQTFINSVQSSIIDKVDYTILPMSNLDSRTKVFCSYDLDMPDELKFLETVIGDDTISNLNLNETELRDIKYIIVVLADDQNEVSLLKIVSPVEVIGSATQLFKKSNNILRIFHDELLRITPKFHAIRINGEIIFTDIAAMERNLGIQEAIINEATSSLREIAQTGLIADMSGLRDLVSDMTFARKLIKVARNSPVLRLNIPNADIISFAQSNPATRNKMKVNAEGTQFNLDTKSSKMLFLKILNDDYLTSELTKQYYDSLAKDGVEVVAAEGSGISEIRVEEIDVN